MFPTLTPQQYQQNLARLRSGMSLDAAAEASTGQVFLQSELTRIDPVLRMPLENYTHYRDIPMPSGGGWMDFEVARNVDFRGPQDGSTGTDSNDVRVIEYNTDQDVWPTLPYQVNVRIPLIESLKMATTGRSPQDLLDKAVRVDWQKSLDVRVYQGIKGNTGLVNSPIVTSQLVVAGAAGPRTWASKTPQEIYNDFNTMAYTAWNNAGGSPLAIPDRYLVPGSQWSALTQPMVVGGTPLALSVAQYLKENGFAKTFGITPEIYPLPVWLETAGASSSKRVISYRFDQDCLSFTLLQNIQRMGGPLSVQAGAFLITYVGNTGVVKVNRPQTINYWDGV
ncbi:MAG TPA: major capsid family protein [Candidatus Limnocylindrales bacterium]|nr:major capsid family protein [Candidatus Limnocylindrales bacterium]